MGLTGKAAAWAVRKFKGHRTISNRALMSIDAVLNN
jgi:cytochrome c5